MKRAPDRIPALASFVRRVKRTERLPFLSVVLFGSVARGSASGESDIDLIVILRRGTRLTAPLTERLHRFVRAFTKKFSLPVSTNIMTPDEFCHIYTPLFYTDLAQHAVELYGKKVKTLLGKAGAARVSRKQQDLIVARRILFPAFLLRQKVVTNAFTNQNLGRECHKQAEYMLRDLYFIFSGRVLQNIKAIAAVTPAETSLWKRCYAHLPSEHASIEQFFAFFEEVFGVALKLLRKKYGRNFVLPVYF